MDLLNGEFVNQYPIKKEEVPKYLYHYTSLSSLALILETRSIRFNRLDRVNDPREATSDIEHTNKLVFSSCWTAESQDELSMWRMYSQHKFGVRIKLQSNPFSGPENIKSYENGICYTKIRTYARVDRETSYRPNAFVYGPNSVHYSDDESELKTRCMFSDSEQKLLDMQYVGLVKGKCWSFEKEWRYRIFAVPLCMSTSHDSDLIEQELDIKSDPVNSMYVDVELSQEAISQMQVMLYPDPDPALRILVEALLYKHKIKTNVLNSSLQVKW